MKDDYQILYLLGFNQQEIKRMLKPKKDLPQPQILNMKKKV